MKDLPKAESVYRFLLMRGWQLKEKNKGFFVLTPPTDFDWQINKMEIPHIEHAPAYPAMITVLVKNLAKFYEWNNHTLRYFLSKSPKEIDQMLKDITQLEIIQKKRNEAQQFVA